MERTLVTLRVVVALVALVALTAGGSCSYNPTLHDCQITCSATTGCPDGFSCSESEGLCRADGVAETCATLSAFGITPGAYLKASNPDRDDYFGVSIALSADGSTLAVGAHSEDSPAVGINGVQSNGGFEGSNSGAVYLFTRVGSSWVQQAYIKASNSEESYAFGGSVALSADGSTLAVGAEGEDIEPPSTPSYDIGAVYVFERVDTSWSETAYLKASNWERADTFGTRVALSDDGSTLAVSARHEASAATGIDNGQSDNSASGAGAVYVFTRGGTTWSQQAYVKASNTESQDGFGLSLSLSSDGSTLAVGAPNEDSAATGVDGDQSDNSVPDAGAVYVFTRVASTWSQQAYVKALAPGGDRFGESVALAGDGSTLAVGAPQEDSSALGVDGDADDDSVADSGAVHVFTRVGSTWSQQAYVKASNTGAGDSFGAAVALPADGSLLVVGAISEASFAMGVGGSQTDDSTPNAGAAYVLARTGASWSHRGYVKAFNTGAEDQFGGAVAVSSDGSMLVVGAPGEASAAMGVDGDQADDALPHAGAVYVFDRAAPP